MGKCLCGLVFAASTDRFTQSVGCVKLVRGMKSRSRRILMITTLNKDITTVTRGIVAHGVNCQGAMGSGVALAIKNKWPKIYEEYKKLPMGKAMLGTAQLVPINDDDTLFVANCFTQVFYGTSGRFADPDAIERSLHLVYRWADYYNLPVFLPKIGALRGGLDWETEVFPIIQQLDSKWDHIETTVCVID